MMSALKLEVNAGISYAVLLWPVLDPHVRYLFARETSRKDLVERSESYFMTVDQMMKGNPQTILDEKRFDATPPVLIIQGSADTNVPLYIPERFVKTYENLGAEISYRLFDGMPHGFNGWSQQLWKDATSDIKRFIAKQLGTGRSR